MAAAPSPLISLIFFFCFVWFSLQVLRVPSERFFSSPELPGQLRAALPLGGAAAGAPAGLGADSGAHIPGPHTLAVFWA